MSGRSASSPARRKAAWPATAAISCGLLGFLGWSAVSCSASEPEPAAAPSAAPSPPAPPEPVAAAGAPTPVASAPENILENISDEVSALMAKCKGAVVRIKGMDRYGPHEGTGFFIDTNGTIYTHYSVAGRSWGLTVEYADKKYPAVCVLSDPYSGVALLKIEAQPTPFLPIGKSEDLRVASPLVAIGYPRGEPASPSFGLVAGFDQKIFDHYLTTTHVRANLTVQPGEQGAPLLNTKGEVMGILVSYLDYGAACLVLPIRAAEKVRNDYVRFGFPHPGSIGVTLKQAGPGEAAELRVDQLAADAPVARSGIKPGDVLVQIGSTPIHQIGDVWDASFFLTADEEVPITVRRGEETLVFPVRAITPPGFQRVEPPKSAQEEGVRLRVLRRP